VLLGDFPHRISNRTWASTRATHRRALGRGLKSGQWQELRALDPVPRHWCSWSAYGAHWPYQAFL